MKLLALIEKYLALAVVGVHAANSVSGASNADKKTVVLSVITAAGDAVANASTDPKVQAASMVIDVVASVVNALTAKTAPVPAA
jgi:hypothetical protein